MKLSAFLEVADPHSHPKGKQSYYEIERNEQEVVVSDEMQYFRQILSDFYDSLRKDCCAALAA